MTNLTWGGFPQVPPHPPELAPALGSVAPVPGTLWTPTLEEVPSSVLEGPVEPESTCPWSLETSSQRPLAEAQVIVPMYEPKSVVVPRRGTRERYQPHWLKDYHP